MMLKIDMHVHTWYSDSVSSVEEVVEIAQVRGLDGIAITDHDTVEGAYEALRKKGNLIIILGEEVETDRGEIISLGIKKAIPKKLPIVESINRIHAQGGLVIIPHPTVPFFNRIKEKSMKNLPIDGLEVFSAITPLSQYFLRKNLALARRLMVSITSGSDSHFPETVGDAYTLVYSENRDIESILHAVKSGRTAVAASSSKFLPKLKMFIGNVHSHFLKDLKDRLNDVTSQLVSVDPRRISSKDKVFHFV